MLPPRAYIFIGLNAVRALSIIALLLVFSSSIFVMVSDIRAFNKFQTAGPSQDDTSVTFLDCDYVEGSTVPNQPAGVFWAVVNRLLIIIQVVILLLSEIGWPSAFFVRFFPVLGPDFGLGALGIFQSLIGAAVLSHHTDDFTLVAAFFLFAIGCLNMVLGLIFRQSAKSKRSITSWRDHAKAVLPTAVTSHIPSKAAPSFVSSVYSTDRADENQHSARGLGFGRQGEQNAGMKGFLISKPLESLPKYTGGSPASSTRSPRTHTPAFKSSSMAI